MKHLCDGFQLDKGITNFTDRIPRKYCKKFQTEYDPS